MGPLRRNRPTTQGRGRPPPSSARTYEQCAPEALPVPQGEYDQSFDVGHAGCITMCDPGNQLSIDFDNVPGQSPPARALRQSPGVAGCDRLRSAEPHGGLRIGHPDSQP